MRLEVATFRVDVDLFVVYGVRFLAGRDFDARDTERGRAVIVNRTFATELADQANVLGLRFRRLPRPELHEIVGVVDDFPGFPRQPGSEGEPTVYHPAAVGDLPFAVLTLRFSGAVPTDIAERLRRIGAEIDPALQLQRIVTLSNFNDELQSVWRAVAWAVAVAMLSVLLLSAAGMHALMSFTIAQRTREIGIRSALGAQPSHLVLGVFGRALRQISLGVLAGSLLSSRSVRGRRGRRRAGECPARRGGGADAGRGIARRAGTGAAKLASAHGRRLALRRLVLVRTRRPHPPRAARRARQSGATGRRHKSMTTSPIGCEQQTRRLPSAGLSSGSGP